MNNFGYKRFFFLLKTIILSIIFITPLYSQDTEWQMYGYAKYLFSISKDVLGNPEQLTDHQLHLRLNNRLYFNTYYTLGLELRLRGFYGSSIDHGIQSPSTAITEYPYDDLDILFWENRSNFGYGQIDRLFFDYSKDSWQITAGRQRIAGIAGLFPG